VDSEAEIRAWLLRIEQRLTALESTGISPLDLHNRISRIENSRQENQMRQSNISKRVAVAIGTATTLFVVLMQIIAHQLGLL